jgi:hypothetical protein
LKQAGSAPGPETIFGAARAATLDNMACESERGHTNGDGHIFLPTLMFCPSEGAGLRKLPPR